jgi:hypothetical protein
MFGQDQDDTQASNQVDNGGDTSSYTPPAVHPSTGMGSVTNSFTPLAPAATTPTTSPYPATDMAATTAPAATAKPVNEELLDIKQKALHALMPVIDKLDQTPEEKFRTTMMVIQASDNQDLIKVAHEAAMQITDEKERALALLSIVNEINYFSQNEATKPATS